MQKPADDQKNRLMNDLQRVSDGQLFIKSLTDIVEHLAPVVGEIIGQGITEGVFSTPYPTESAEILLSAAHALFDNTDLQVSEHQQTQRMGAFLISAERILGAEPGSLLRLAVLFE